MRVPNYTKGLVLERAVPNQVDLGRIQEAGTTFSGVAKALDVAGQIRQQVEVANELTAVNGAVIRKQKDDIDFRQAKQKEWQDNPLGFAKEMEIDYKKRDEEYIKSLPTESAKAAYQQSVEKLNLRNYEEDLNWETNRSAEMFVNKADQSISDLEVMAFRGASIDELNKNRQATMLTLGGILSSDELMKFDEKAQERIATSSIDGLIDRNPYEAKQVLDSRQYDSALGAEALASLSAKTEKAIITQERKELELQERNADFATVGLALDGKAILDPFNKNTKKAVDAYYNAFAQDLLSMPPKERLQAQIDLVSTLGVYPSAMESAISAQLNNGSAEQKVQAAEFIDSIAVNNPSTVTQINESQRARARSIVDNINAGLQPSKAVETAEAMAFKKDTPEYKQRLENFNRKGGDKQSFKPRDFRETFRNDPDEIPASMQADWELLNQNFYMEGLDATQSAELATNTVKSQWAITNADGSNRWMKYAPEAVYKNEAGSDWIKEQLESEISQMPSITGSGNKNKLYLAVDPRTIKSPNKAYQIFEKDENGIVQPYLTGSGEQAVFVPDFKESPMYKRLLEENNNNEEQAMEAAIMARKRVVLKEEEARINKKRKLDRSKAFTDKIDRLFDANN